MKRHLKAILSLTIIVFSLSLITSCGKKTQPENPVAGQENETKNPQEVSEEQNEEKPNTNSNEEEVPLEKLEVELGNDMGKNITKLFIRATESDEWREIKLKDNLWQSGYIIPVALEAKTIPNPEKGWYVLIEFEDSSEKLFEGVALNTEKSIILTEDGVLY